MTDFFETNSFFIDQKVNFFQFENTYKIFDESGNQIGVIQQKIPFLYKFLSLFISEALLPFHFKIINENNVVEASISRGWTFFMSKIIIKDTAGNEIGKIQQKFKFIKQKLLINDSANNLIAEISGDWKFWNFSIKDGDGNEIGKVSKRWTGGFQEIFTDEDKYNVNFNVKITDKQHKAAILSSAIAIDMIFSENKISLISWI